MRLALYQCQKLPTNFSNEGDEEHLVTPQRDKLETTLRQRIVPRPSAPAFATHRPAVRARVYLNLKARNRSTFHPARRPVDKRFEFLHPIEDSLDLHPVPFALIDGCFATSIFSEPGQDALPFVLQNNYLYRSKSANVLPTNFPEEPIF
jgi:hypothetical protein